MCIYSGEANIGGGIDITSFSLTQARRLQNYIGIS